MQPYFFPYIGYFQAIRAADKYILYNNLDFITEGWMNRNRIMIKGHNPAYIHVIVNAKSSNKKIFEIEVNCAKNWKKKLIKTLELNYKGSKYFDETFFFLKELILQDNKLLFEYNGNIIKKISEYLEIDTEIVYEDEKYRSLEMELLHLDKGDYSVFPDLFLTRPVKKVARVIQICKKENAKIFINAIGGRELYNKDEFLKYGIEIYFIETKEYKYNQFSQKFHSNLSIIDVLMHNGKENTIKLLNQYELI